MDHRKQSRTSLSFAAILAVTLLFGLTGGPGEILAEGKGKGYGKHRRGGFSSSLKLTTTTGVVRAVAVQQQYIDREIAAIQEESSRGEGPHLVALAELREETNPAAFSQWMQTHSYPSAR